MCTGHYLQIAPARAVTYSNIIQGDCRSPVTSLFRRNNDLKYIRILTI